jgi:shikimate kinase
MEVLDIDDNVLSPAAAAPYPRLTLDQINRVSSGAQFVLEDAREHFIAERVAAMSTQEFLEWEAGVTNTYPFENLRNTIVSTTGSNPLRPTVIARIRQFMPIIWIDIPDDTIVLRLWAKDPITGIERVAGIKEHGSIEKLLAYRRNFYRAAADLVFTPSTENLLKSEESTASASGGVSPIAAEFAKWMCTE